ncbi:bath-42 [Symbiodinium sp. CCMP2456]|nr:bath-42 [Symbiodinium sp. CCMP2456]
MTTRGSKRPRLEAEAPGSSGGPLTATAEQVSDLRLEFGENGEDSMPANSALLRMASPVFNRMFTSGMREAQQGVIKVEVASKEEFEVFYEFLLPMAWGAQVTVNNVDSLLAISDYYQVEIIKQGCEKCLLLCAPTARRLLQAHKHGLTRQYERCIGFLAKNSTKADLELLRSQPDILFDLTLRKQVILKRLRAMKGEIVRHQAAVEPKNPIFEDADFANGRKFSKWEYQRISVLLRARPGLRVFLRKLLQELE